MNQISCFEVRRLLLADPLALPPSARAHLAQCTACRNHDRRQQQHEAHLREALSVEVPAGIAERVLLAREVGRRWRPTRWAMAAALALLAVTPIAWLSTRDTGTDWALVAAEHVAQEPQALSGIRPPDRAAVAVALSEWGLAASASLGRWLYLDRCAMPNGNGLHAVFETEELGRVTLILPPRGNGVAGAQARYGDFYADAFAADGMVIAVVTEDPKLLRPARNWLSAHLARL